MPFCLAMKWLPLSEVTSIVYSLYTFNSCRIFQDEISFIYACVIIKEVKGIDASCRHVLLCLRTSFACAEFSMTGQARINVKNITGSDSRNDVRASVQAAVFRLMPLVTVIQFVQKRHHLSFLSCKNPDSSQMHSSINRYSLVTVCFKLVQGVVCSFIIPGVTCTYLILQLYFSYEIRGPPCRA